MGGDTFANSGVPKADTEGNLGSFGVTGDTRPAFLQGDTGQPGVGSRPWPREAAGASVPACMARVPQAGGSGEEAPYLLAPAPHTKVLLGSVPEPPGPRANGATSHCGGVPKSRVPRSGVSTSMRTPQPALGQTRTPQHRARCPQHHVSPPLELCRVGDVGKEHPEHPLGTALSRGGDTKETPKSPATTQALCLGGIWGVLWEGGALSVSEYNHPQQHRARHPTLCGDKGGQKQLPKPGRGQVAP